VETQVGAAAVPAALDSLTRESLFPFASSAPRGNKKSDSDLRSSRQKLRPWLPIQIEPAARGIELRRELSLQPYRQRNKELEARSPAARALSGEPNAYFWCGKQYHRSRRILQSLTNEEQISPVKTDSQNWNLDEFPKDERTRAARFPVRFKIFV